MSIKIPSHILVAGSSWLSRVVSATVQIVCIKFLINSLGENGYAAFSLLSALVAWTALFDFGIGNALQNYISERRAVGLEYNDFIKRGGILSIVFLILFIIVSIPLSEFLAPLYLKDYVSHSEHSKTYLFFIAVAVFLLTSFGSIIFKIWYAEQRGWYANIIIALSSILGLFFIFLLNEQGIRYRVDWMIIVFFGPLAIISSICFLVRIANSIFIKAEKKKPEPLIKRTMIQRSLHFWLFTAIGTIVLQADSIVMSQKLSSQDIVAYVIMMKLFGLMAFIYTALLQAVWPVCVELRVMKQWVDLNKLVNRYILFGVSLVVISTLFLYAFKNSILGLISKDISSDIPLGIFLLFATYFSIRVWSDTYAMLLQSMNTLRPLWLIVPLQAIASFSLQWYLADKFNIYGMLIGLISSFILTVVFILPITYKRKIRELKNA
ncbi:MATE family efflux transporter [Photorhabdus akhurstii]|uniref:MATE family efflux transporter n=1 Tax=Photorhabdus akhurstii TaxID=171438 RepID=UPI003703E513